MSKDYKTERIKKKFAFVPTIISTEDGSYRIWMMSYFIKQRWTKNAGAIRTRGMFSNQFYDGWETIGEGFNKNVITWKKYR